MAQQYKPGQQVPYSGQARNNTTKTEVTVVKGERMPPTPKPNQTYTMVDRTKHKR
jgi:hypothetical protein